MRLNNTMLTPEIGTLIPFVLIAFPEDTIPLINLVVFIFFFLFVSWFSYVCFKENISTLIFLFRFTSLESPLINKIKLNLLTINLLTLRSGQG